MGNHTKSDWEELGRFKSIRQKKRLQKKDFDKQLIQLSNTRNELWDKVRALPLVPLETPYQRGWMRTFVLRNDVAISKDSEFFQRLLDKINTVQYSHKKLFQVKKRHRGKKIYVSKPQRLKTLTSCEWSRNSARNWEGKEVSFSEKEKTYFAVREVIGYNGRTEYEYYFTEAWRFVLKTKANLITHTRMKDHDLMSQLRKLENYLDQHHLSHKIQKLVRGKKQNWHFEKTEHTGLKNKSVNQILFEYDSETQDPKEIPNL